MTISVGATFFGCSSDFLSRVGGEVATKGRVQTSAGVTSSGNTSCACPPSSPVADAIASMIPQNVSEADLETLIQTITDQIMATA